MSKNDTIDQLNTLFKTIQMENTLSPAAVVDYNKAIEQVSNLSEELEQARKNSSELGKTLNESIREYKELEDEVAQCKLRETNLQKREAEITKLELTSEYEQRRVQDHKDMFGIVFRNTEVRKKVLDIEDRSDVDEHGNWVNKNVTKSYTTSETKD